MHQVGSLNFKRLRVIGVNEVVDDALNIVKNLKASGIGKEILDITNAIGDAFKGLEQTFTRKQRKEMTNKKYTYMNKEQLNHLYGENGSFPLYYT